MAPIINWFEIYTADFERAVRFYSAVLGRTLEVAEGSANWRMAFFAPDETEVKGAVAHTQSEHLTPGPNGPTVYLTVEGDLDEMLARVVPAGGRVLNPKTPIGDGSGSFWARFEDTEGNRIGLLSHAIGTSLSEEVRMTPVINWFEIPSVDFERAVGFYGAVLGRTFEVIEGPSNGRMAPFAPLETEVNGAIVYTDLYTAGPNGAALYLTVDGKMDDYLARVEPAGGRVINPKTPIGDGTGYWARIEDTEGNHVGLYTRT